MSTGTQNRHLWQHFLTVVILAVIILAIIIGGVQMYFSGDLPARPLLFMGLIAFTGCIMLGMYCLDIYNQTTTSNQSDEGSQPPQNPVP